MAISVVMPALEMAQETGRLIAWHKREGDAVRKGELLMDVETDKAVVEIEAPADGLLVGVGAREGDVVKVGAVIAWIAAPGESVPTAPGSTLARPMTSPKARRLAAEQGIDVRRARGTGPGGAVTAADLPSAEPRAETTPWDARKPEGSWRIMADRMIQSWTTAPHFFLSSDVDASALVEAHGRLRSGGVDLTYTDLLVALVARALRHHPALNASFVEGGIQVHDAIHIGIATATDEGVVVPVIHDAETAPLEDIARRRRELVAKARARRLRPADLARGTFTISNLGMYPVTAFSAILNPPQAAILAVGRIADRVVAVGGEPAVRPTLTLTLSCDHRAVDGARAAAFLGHLTRTIEDSKGILK